MIENPILMTQAACGSPVRLAIAELGLVQQDEIRERAKKLQEFFANDYPLFIDLVLNRKTPAAATVSRLRARRYPIPMI